MLWFYLTLLSVIGTAIPNIYRRMVMAQDKSDAFASAILFQFFGTVVVGVFAIWHGFVLPPYTRYPINFLIEAVFWSMATLCLFKASHYLEASESTIFATLTTVVTIISAVILLHENFSIQYVIGTICIILSVMYISYQRGKMRMSKGIGFILLYCLLSGLGSTNDAFMLKHVDTLSYLTSGFFIEGIVMVLVKPKALKEVLSIVPTPTFGKMFLLSFFYALGAIAFFFALHVGGQASQVSPINQSAVILTILLGTIFLHERDHLLKKILATILVTIGVLLLS